jgi:hypothetical protein
MTTENKLSDLSAKPARHACRYQVTLTNGDTFTVFVHRGSVPREVVGKMLAHHETIRKIDYYG